MTLEILTSDALGSVRHGFFTRRGGASSGIFEGLNCGAGSSDQAEAVALNRARVAEAMQVDAQSLLSLHQIHSADVEIVTAPRADRPKADAMVTNTPGIALGILTADCQPVLFSDPDNNVIAAAHAGWRGALDGVLEATLDAMESLGATRATTQIAIGPCISQRSYEVGPDFFDTFVAEDQGNARFFANGAGDRLQFDLTGFSLARMRAAGAENVEWTGHCTYEDEDRFFSYRRSHHKKHADYGRLMSAIRL